MKHTVHLRSLKKEPKHFLGNFYPKVSSLRPKFSNELSAHFPFTRVLT